MKGVTIYLTQVSQVQHFVNAMSQYPFDIDLVAGRYTVDAKSLLGIYSLDLGQPLKAVLHSDETGGSGRNIKGVSVTALSLKRRSGDRSPCRRFLAMPRARRFVRAERRGVPFLVQPYSFVGIN